MSDEVPTQPLNLPLLVTKESITGATYIVTGASTGLGFEAAKHLVELGAKKVILAVRNVDPGSSAKKRIDEATGTTDITELWALDLCRFDSVKAFAKRAVAELDRIDAVIENAAIATPEDTIVEGHGITLTVNVLSNFLLAVLLLPKLKESAEKYDILPRLSMVTSGLGWDFRELWEEIRDDPFVKMDALPAEKLMNTYPLSKLIITIAVRELAAQLPLEQGKVVINSVCPGLCKTELIRNCPPEQKQAITDLHQQFGRTAEVGSRTLLAGISFGEESHGAYTSDCQIRNDKVKDWAKGEEGQKWQKHLWDVLVKELETVEPDCVRKALLK